MVERCVHIAKAAGPIPATPTMKIHFTLERIKTRDGIELDGVFAEPKRKSGKALIFVHGLGGNFYGGHQNMLTLADFCYRNGIAFVSFNTRGHDVVSRFYKKRGETKKRMLGGAGFERFEHCVYDIDACIKFVRSQGYKKVFLAGHSTGANKVLYHLYKTKDRRVAGLALLGPLSDVVGQMKELGRRFNAVLEKVKKFSKHHMDEFVPSDISSKIITARRYLSLYTPGSREDVFQYYNPKGKFKELKSIKVPVFVIVGEKDEYLDRKAEELVQVFENNADSTKDFRSAVIRNAGHGFAKRETILARIITDWIKSIK